jgi:hypothetical protein
MRTRIFSERRSRDARRENSDFITGFVFGTGCGFGSITTAPQQVRIKQPETTVTQEKSHEDLRGTTQSPLIIEVAPTPKTDTERSEETKERERITELERNKEKSDSDIVRYTKELAFFTPNL